MLSRVELGDNGANVPGSIGLIVSGTCLSSKCVQALVRSIVVCSYR